jgi:hypothetical protein
LFLETFVDTERFAGTCYKAANWRYLGDTMGRGKTDRTHKQSRSIFLLSKSKTPYLKTYSIVYPY